VRELAPAFARLGSPESRRLVIAIASKIFCAALQSKGSVKPPHFLVYTHSEGYYPSEISPEERA
jgi:hypothetical protein